jgi:RHS repeat-associated protein
VGTTNVSPATVVSYDDFDAWGMTLESRSAINGDNRQRFRFTGKERDVESGYDYFGARYHDARIGRWLSVDQVAASYPGLTPFCYCADNPFRFVDSDGREIKLAPNSSIRDQKALASFKAAINSCPEGQTLWTRLDDGPDIVVGFPAGILLEPREKGTSHINYATVGPEEDPTDVKYAGGQLGMRTNSTSNANLRTFLEELYHFEFAHEDPHRDYMMKRTEDKTIRDYYKKRTEQLAKDDAEYLLAGIRKVRPKSENKKAETKSREVHKDKKQHDPQKDDK